MVFVKWQTILAIFAIFFRKKCLYFTPSLALELYYLWHGISMGKHFKGVWICVCEFVFYIFYLGFQVLRNQSKKRKQSLFLSSLFLIFFLKIFQNVNFQGYQILLKTCRDIAAFYLCRKMRNIFLAYNKMTLGTSYFGWILQNIFLSDIHKHRHTHAHFLYFTHTHTHTHIRTFCLNLSQIHNISLTFSHTHTFSNTWTHEHTLSLPLLSTYIHISHSRTLFFSLRHTKRQ